MRRNWLAIWLISMLLGALIIAACAPAAPRAATPPAEEKATRPAASGRCGDPDKLSDTLHLYNWSEYIDPDILRQFEEECGVKVIEDTFASNEELLAKLQAGATGYDVIVPSEYMVSIMINLGMLAELDHDNIPNLKNLYEQFRNASFDPGNRYSVPYQWGTTGIGYDADKVDEPIDSWAYLFDPERVKKYAGKVSLLNDVRETMGAALKYLGYSVNDTDPAHLEEAKQVIMGIKPYLALFDSDSFEDLLVSGEIYIALGWSGDFFRAFAEAEEGRDLRYIIPKEGAVIWVDCMAIPKTAPHKYTAEVFINYILDPQIGAQLSNWNYYASPNQAAEPFIDEEIRNDPGIYPPPEVMEKLEFLADVGEATSLYERIWTEIKSE